MKKAILTLFLLSLVPAAFASELLVPSQHSTIQSAIAAASNGDTVIVELSIYHENINFRGKAITVRSSEPSNWAAVTRTIIDGGGSGSCVVFDTGEGSNSVLEGFTLANGAGTYVDYSYYNGRAAGYAGGGVFCLNSSPTIRHCNITGNEPRGPSGPVPPPRRRSDYMSLLQDPIVSCGGGIALIGNCQATIDNCFVTNNSADYGPGIIIRSYTPEQAASMIRNCTIANNWSGFEPSEYEMDCWDTRPVIYNTIIWGNNHRSLFIADPSLVTYSCVREAYIFEGDYDELADPCDLSAAGGNVSQNPLFAEPVADSAGADYYPDWAFWQPGIVFDKGDYHLLQDSPCINTGDPDFTGSGETDIDGQSRVMAGRVDIGADEVVSEIIVTRPSGGDVWASGSTHEIRWSGPRGVAVDILLSTNGGADWQTIAESVLDAVGFRCALPETADSDDCLVSVVPSIPDASVVCTESGVFTIRPYSLGTVVESRWKSLGGDFGRAGLSDSSGPELGCLKWEFETGGAVSASVSIGSDDCVYVPCEDGKLYALDPNGSPLWSYDANSPLISSPTIGPDGTVYVGGQNGKLHAVDVNGSLRWTHSTRSPISSSPAVSDSGNVYVASQDGVLYALAQDGSEVWSFETKGPGEVQRGSIFASPAIGTDGTVYVAGLYDPNLYALDPNDGSLKWTCNFESPMYPDYPDGPKESGWPFASPVVAEDGTIYQMLVYDSNLYAIDSSDGTVIWSTDLKIHCDFVDQYVRMHGGLPEMEEIRENCTYWIQFLSEPDTYWAYIKYRDASGWSEPALGPDDTIYVSFDDPYLRAVDPNGSIKWVTDLGVVGGFTLTVGENGLIYAAGDDGFLYVVDADGWEVARFSGDNWLNHPVIAGDDVIIVSDGRDDSLMITGMSNKVRAIELDGCAGRTFDLALIEDLDADGDVDFVDLALFAADWLECTYADWPCSYEGDQMYLAGDIDRDRYVYSSDLKSIAERWLGGPRTSTGPRPPKPLGPPAGWPEPPEPPQPPPKGRGCFLPGTPVWADGALVRISDAVSGQMVGRPGSDTALSSAEQIQEIQEHAGIFECYDMLLETGDCISVANSHYFLTDSRRWIRLQDLQSGIRLQSLRGPVSVSRIAKRAKPFVGKCYNLKIEGTDRYFVGQQGIIVRDW